MIGNDDTDLDLQSAEVSVSENKGLTWSTDPDNEPELPFAGNELSEPPSVTRAVNPMGKTENRVDNVGGVVEAFASSGHDIHLRYGENNGLMIQQYAGSIT